MYHVTVNLGSESSSSNNNKNEIEMSIDHDRNGSSIISTQVAVSLNLNIFQMNITIKKVDRKGIMSVIPLDIVFLLHTSNKITMIRHNSDSQCTILTENCYN